MEAVAILPQLIVLQRYSVVENLTGHYVFFLGAYRGLYILNWVRSLVTPLCLVPLTFIWCSGVRWSRHFAAVFGAAVVF